MNKIDLRSDTVTQPTPEMREVMAAAIVGDDVYGEDPSVNELEAYAASLLGFEAALYVSSGTQSNLLALLTHCGRGDEYIVGQNAHTYRFEGGGAAALGGIQPQPIDILPDGSLDLSLVEANIKPDDFHFAKTKVLCLENTTSGQALAMSYMQAARDLCDQYHLQLHLDGARFFNAAIDSGVSPSQLAAPFHSVSICLSKGLGAPVGSVLLGSKQFIQAARRWRKVLGGGMRQAGIIAAAGHYVLQNNLLRLAEDHGRAQRVANALGAMLGNHGLGNAAQIEQFTNMVHLQIDGEIYAQLSKHLASYNIRVGRPRWVFHLGVDQTAEAQILEAIATFAYKSNH